LNDYNKSPDVVAKRAEIKDIQDGIKQLEIETSHFRYGDENIVTSERTFLNDQKKQIKDWENVLDAEVKLVTEQFGSTKESKTFKKQAEALKNSYDLETKRIDSELGLLELQVKISAEHKKGSPDLAASTLEYEKKLKAHNKEYGDSKNKISKSKNVADKLLNEIRVATEFN